MRRATNHRDSRRLVENAISIHALLAESDTIFAVRPYDAPIFLSTLSLRRATLLKERTINWHQFLSTLSLRRATPRGRFPVVFYLISIHALLAESDVLGWLPVGQTQRFLSTLSLRRATDWFFTGTLDPKFLSTLSLRRATHHGTNSGTNSTIFLSTLSLRRATVVIVAVLHIITNFYPRSPCGERRAPSPPRREFYKISIHALLAESDSDF